MIVIGEHPRSWHCENNDCGNTSSNALFFLYLRSSDWKLKLVAPQVFKEIEMTIQAKPEEASKVSTNCLFQIYWSCINAWSKFKTNAGEHGLPVHHQTRRNASEALVWVSLARKANYFMYATLMLHLCVWILLDDFPSIGSSIQSSVFGGISSLCKPCGFSRLFSHLWWQGLLQTGKRWCPMKQIWWLSFAPHAVSFQASGDMSPQKAVALGKLKVRGNFLLLQKLQGIFWIHNHYPKLNQVWFVYFGLSLSKT